MPEMDEQPAEIPAVLFDSVVELANVRPLQEPQDFLLQLATAFSRDDLYGPDALFDGLVHRLLECRIDLAAPIEDVVKVELDP
jgi:hypothetical protein